MKLFKDPVFVAVVVSNGNHKVPVFVVVVSNRNHKVPVFVVVVSNRNHKDPVFVVVVVANRPIKTPSLLLWQTETTKTPRLLL